MSDFQRRVLGAARLDAATYEEVEQDVDAIRQAFAVVLLSAAAAAVGDVGRVHLGGLVVTMLIAVVSWVIWAAVTFVIGTRLLAEAETRADLGQLLRTIGFAAAPGLVRVLGVIGPVRPLVFGAAQLWMIVAMVVAVRHALDYTSTGRAVAVCVIGWVVQLLVVVTLAALLLPASDAPVARSGGDIGEPPSAGYVGVVKPSGVAPPVH